MEEEIKKVIPEGYKMTSFTNDLLNGKIIITIEMIKDDFGKYWKRFWFERYNIIDYQSFDYYDWEVLILFYHWFAKELNGDWKPDWSNGKYDKFHIYYFFNTKTHGATSSNYNTGCFNIHFSEEAAEKALKILPKEFLDKLFQI